MNHPAGYADLPHVAGGDHPGGDDDLLRLHLQSLADSPSDELHPLPGQLPDGRALVKILLMVFIKNVHNFNANLLPPNFILTNGEYQF